MTRKYFRKVLMTAMLTLLLTSTVGCIVPYRAHYYDRYRRSDHYHRYDPDSRYDWRSNRHRWYRD